MYHVSHSFLVGNFLFRYSSERGESPKGVPIPLDAVTSINEGSGFTFELSTIRKTYVLRASSAQERKSWIKAIRDRKVEAVRENMGHVDVAGTVQTFNKAGESIFQNRLKKDGDSMKEGTENPLFASAR